MDLLKSVLKVPGASGKEGIAVVQPRKNESGNESFAGLNREVMAYGVDTTQLKVSGLDQVDYMSGPSQVHVKRYPKISG